MNATVPIGQHHSVLRVSRLIWAISYLCFLILIAWRLVTGVFVQKLAGEFMVELSLPFLAASGSSGLFFLYLTILRHGALALFWLAAALIFWRRAHDWIGLLVAALLLLMPITLTLGGSDAAWQTLVTFLSLALFVLLLFVFPDGCFIPQSRQNRVLLGVGVCITPIASFGFLSAFLRDFTPAEHAYGAFILTLAAIMTSGVASQIYRFRTAANATQRQQTRWVVFGLSIQLIWILWWILFFVGLLDSVGISQFGQALMILHINIFVPLLIPIAFSVAMLRDGLWPRDPVVNRVLVYGALSTLIVLAYVLLVGTLGALFQALGGFLTALVATGVVAFLFQPVRDRMQQAVNRLMYGERDDPAGVFGRLASQLEVAGTINALLASMVEDIAAALKLPHVAIWLPAKGDEQWQLAASAGDGDLPALESITMRHKSQVIGRLVVARRSPGERFSHPDRQLLANIAQLVATTIHAQQLNDQLQQSRQQLVTAREEERRRIRRDLHDGLGPAMAAITLQADTAKDLVRTDPDEAVVLLQKITTKTQKSVVDIRHLVYGLRPPALDELGLAGAIRQYISSLASGNLVIVFTATENLPALPAAVEVAAYRIIQEAITNVIHHAEATSCSIRLSVDGGLHLEVVDDGVGLPADRQNGIGLRSMRERAAELSGKFGLEAVRSGGTRVFAWLPLSEAQA